ncbi:hypothetical protein A3D81_01615 [Candidatus Curtissbacteria bacterium RIFCSPHIGHO2_02_FULL_40_17]|uniref:D-glycerate dehydrogenase n=3 Tax=Candidatus Curtissiibacteriota TaxID=1752717 RepID=A0A1F5GH28_9BACT|nr:MAG: hypothetical protein A2693_03375 [Candidatus Curtissbacteria bacterium RIFCSPHIGHO2_01_FULL_40_12]OGD91155.1 MAG: hypothetical protein A3D81_01615 [Candidatus Curtissbacteria bacterium RIFCSPHIGHO2_02_FULL_40_17]OGE07139.1 MAG: hypothetical protein A3I53_02990 [Candidatus Curtissbacteria bacterium RIFCSPLOWO2_02_FULL_40_13b]
MPSVYITSQIPQIGINLLKQKGFTVETNNSGKYLTKDQLKNVFYRYNAVLIMMTDKIDMDILKSASSNLKVIANYAVGYDNIDVLDAKRKGIIVTNTPGVASESVAEHTFLLIFAASKKLIEADKFVRLGKYQKWDPMSFLSSQIWGKTIGIIGLGKIGVFVGQIAYSGLRMKILYYDIARAEDFELLTEAKFTSLDQLLKEADIITIHCPLTEKTRHLIGNEQFDLMKKSAILINTARGPIIDENALIEALKNGKIAAAGLDVFEFEPQISEELLKLPNVVLTPHIASATVETREAMSRIAAENIIAVFEGKEPYGLVKTLP